MPYPLGAKFGQFVHVGSMLKSSLEYASFSHEESWQKLDDKEGSELAAALSALIPSAERSTSSFDR